MTPYSSPLYFLLDKILIGLIAFLDTSHPTPRPTGLYLMDIQVLRTCIFFFFLFPFNLEAFSDFIFYF